MTVDESKRRWEVAAAAVVALVVWLALHLLVFVPEHWWAATFEGEWDVLLAAKALAAGNPPIAAVGTIHGFEIGSYVTSAGAGGLLALGLSPTDASRVTAAVVGASGIAVAAGGVHWFGLTKGHSPWLATALTIALGAICWPHWHFLNLGVTGTTLEAAAILTLATVVAMPVAPSRRRLAGCGALLGAGLLYSPLMLAALPPVLFVLGLAGPLPRWARAVAVVGGFVASGLVVALVLPGGFAALINVGWFLKGIVPAVFDPSSTLGPAEGQHILLRVLRVHAPPGFYPAAAWTVPAMLLGLAGPAAAIWLVVRGDELGRRLGGVTLYWLVLLCLLFLNRGAPETFRYWSVYGLLGLVCIGYALVGANARWVGVTFTVPGVGLLLTLTATSVLPPPGRTTAEIMTTLGVHRTPQRLGVRPGVSERHGTFIDLLPYVPADHQDGFAQGYGINVADDLSPPGMIDWWPEWDLRLLKPNVPVDAWRSFVFGLGCGVAVQPSLNPDRLELLEGLESEDMAPLGLGIGTCLGHRPGGRAAHGDLRSFLLPVEGWRACAAEVLGVQPGAVPEFCSVRLEPAVPRLWTFSSTGGGARK